MCEIVSNALKLVLRSTILWTKVLSCCYFQPCAVPCCASSAHTMGRTWHTQVHLPCAMLCLLSTYNGQNMAHPGLFTMCHAVPPQHIQWAEHGIPRFLFHVSCGARSTHGQNIFTMCTTANDHKLLLCLGFHATCIMYFSSKAAATRNFGLQCLDEELQDMWFEGWIDANYVATILN